MRKGAAGKTTRREAHVPNIVYSCSLLCETRLASIRHHMVDIAQPVEHLIVVQKVARSSRVIHPISPGFARGFCYFPALCSRCDSARWVVVPLADWLRQGRRQGNQYVRRIDRVARQAAMGSGMCCVPCCWCLRKQGNHGCWQKVGSLWLLGIRAGDTGAPGRSLESQSLADAASIESCPVIISRKSSSESIFARY